MAADRRPGSVPAEGQFATSPRRHRHSAGRPRARGSRGEHVLPRHIRAPSGRRHVAGPPPPRSATRGEDLGRAHLGAAGVRAHRAQPPHALRRDRPDRRRRRARSSSCEVKARRPARGNPWDALGERKQTPGARGWAVAYLARGHRPAARPRAAVRRHRRRHRRAWPAGAAGPPGALRLRGSPGSAGRSCPLAASSTLGWASTTPPSPPSPPIARGWSTRALLRVGSEGEALGSRRRGVHAGDGRGDHGVPRPAVPSAVK